MNLGLQALTSPASKNKKVWSAKVSFIFNKIKRASTSKDCFTLQNMRRNVVSKIFVCLFALLFKTHNVLFLVLCKNETEKIYLASCVSFFSCAFKL